MNNDSIQKIIEEMREEFFIEPIDEEQVNLWADRLEVLAKGIEADCAKIEAMIEMLR